MSWLITKIKAHLHNTLFYQTIFSLPFAIMGALIGAGGNLPANAIWWIIVTIFCARSAALAIDNFVDLKYDKIQSRMANRPMVRGLIGKKEALTFIVICFIGLIYAVNQLHPICLYLLPAAAMPFVVYPFMKRFTCLSHIWLGVSIAMAPAGGWVAVTGEIFNPIMILLAAAVVLWIAGFDIVYGAQDEAFDREQGLNSMAVAFGVKRAMEIAAVLHIFSIVCFGLVGFIAALGKIYFIGVAIAGVTLICQHYVVRDYDFSRVNHVYFLRNGLVSIAIGICTWLSYQM